MFGFDEEVNDQSNPQGGKFFQPGINNHPDFPELKDVKTYVTGMNFGEAEDDNSPYFEINMADSEGRELNHRYYEPTKGQFIETDEDLEKAQKKISKVFANFARKFMGDDYTMPMGTFSQVTKKMIADIKKKHGDKFTEIPLRTKVLIKQSTNFPKLPGYAPIWERMDKVEPENSGLKINPQFNDKVEPETPDPEEGAVESGETVWED